MSPSKPLDLLCIVLHTVLHLKLLLNDLEQDPKYRYIILHIWAKFNEFTSSFVRTMIYLGVKTKFFKLKLLFKHYT